MALRIPHFIERGVRITGQCLWKHPFQKPGREALWRLPGRVRTGGFSLVEVVISLGIVAFAMLSTVGLLPLGLDTVRESMNQTVTASIVQEIRGELQQISFLSSTSFNIEKLFATDYAQYYGIDGIKTAGMDKAYYKATFSEASATTAAGATFTSGNLSDPCNAKNVTVTLSYPLNAPENGRKMVFSLLIARQNSH